MIGKVSKIWALVAGGALLLAACSGNADSSGGQSSTGTTGGSDTGTAEVVVITAAHQLAVGTPYDQGLNKFAELVEEKTDGRVVVEVFPNAQLGNETEMFQSLQAGTLDVGIFAPGSIAEYFPGITLVSMPYLIADRDHRDAVLESGVLEPIESAISEATGTEVLSYFGGSQRQMFFTDPASGIDDVAGRLFRVQPSEMLADSFGQMGLEPTVVAYTELYNALGQRVVLGAENEAVYIESQAFFEPAPHILLTNHEITFRPMMVSSSLWDRMDAELETLVRAAADEAGAYARQVEGDADVDTLSRLGTFDGVTVTEVDTSRWVEDMATIWAKYASVWGVEDILESISSLR